MSNSLNYLPIDNKIFVSTSAVTDAATNAPVTDATITAAILTSAGTSLVTGSLTHTSGGIYTGTVDLSQATGGSLMLNDHYYLKVSASNYALEWKRLYRAEDRPLVGTGSMEIDFTPGTSGLPNVTGIPKGDGSGSYSAATKGTDYAAPGSAIITHKDGTQTVYAASANTNAARGAALIAAVAAWATGEDLFLSPGTYEMGGTVTGATVGIQMPSGASLRGGGPSLVTIKSNHSNCIVFTSNCVLKGFTIYGEQIDSNSPSSQVPITDNAIAATGVIISDVLCNGESDGYFPTGAGTTAQIYNSSFTNYFDCVRVTGTAATHDFYNCTFTTTTQPLGGYSTTRSVSVGSSGTVRLWNCKSTNSNNSSTRCCAANTQTTGGTLEIYGGYYSATNAGVATPHDLDCQNGTMKVNGAVIGSGTSGSLVTSGSISWIAGGVTAFGVVTLVHKDGTQTNYPATANTNAARWTALTTANTAAAAGDKMQIGPGTYDGTTQLAFNSNLVAISGAGLKATVLHSTLQSNVHCAFLPASNQEFFGIDFEGVSQTDITGGSAGNQPFGAEDSDTAFTNINIHDCKIGGAVDGFFVKNDSACSGVLRNVDIITEFDSVRGNTVTAVTPAHAFDFYNCTFTQGGTNASNKRGVVINMGTWRFFNCISISDDTSDSGGAGAHLCLGYSASGANTIIEVHGGKVSNTAGSSNNDFVQASSGTLKIDSAVVGGGTGGSPVTSGTITLLPVSGTVPTSQGLAALGSAIERVYPMPFSSVVGTFAASSIYYLGVGGSIQTTEGQRLISVPIAGTLKTASIGTAVAGTLGSAETSTVALRVNNTTDTTLSAAVKFDAASHTYVITGLSLALSAGDLLEIKMTTGAFGTAPTNASMAVYLMISY